MPYLDEREALQTSAVFLDDGHDVLRATGNDRLSFLQRITSGKLGALAPGQGAPTLLLDVKGRVLASLLVFARSKSVRLVVARGAGESVAAGLAKFAIMDDFQIAAEPQLASLAVLGPRAGTVLQAVGVDLPASLLEAPRFTHEEIATTAFGPLWVARGRRCGVDGFCVVGATAERDALVAALGAGGTSRLPAELAEVARIVAIEPAPGKELTPDRFPVEVGLGAAIDHGKGCYVGQETIVRMRDRGNVRKRLALLELEGETVPTAGDKLVADGQAAAGQITSAARVAGEPPVALAIVANAVAVGVAVRVQHDGGQLVARVAAESPPWG